MASVTTWLNFLSLPLLQSMEDTRTDMQKQKHPYSMAAVSQCKQVDSPRTMLVTPDRPRAELIRNMPFWIDPASMLSMCMLHAEAGCVSIVLLCRRTASLSRVVLVHT
jgi:hypothetical protein